MIQAIGLLQFGPVGDAIYAAFATFLTEVFAFIPNLIAAALIFLVGYLIVRVVVKALKVGMTRANLEKHVAHTSIGQFIERSGHTITGLVTGGIKWLLILIVAFYAISALNIAPLTISMLAILAWLPNLVAAAIIVFAGALIGSYIGKGIENILPRYGVNGGRIIGLAVELLIYALVFNFALIQIGFGAGIIYTITTALVWGLAAALAIGFGVGIAYSLKGVLPPMVSSTTSISSTLKEGQQVTVEGIPYLGEGDGKLTGIVKSVGMFNIILERNNGGTKGGKGNGNFVVLPNNLLMDRPIIVEGGEAPKPWEHGMRDRMSDFHGKFEENMSRSNSISVPQTSNTSGGMQYAKTEGKKSTSQVSAGDSTVE